MKKLNELQSYLTRLRGLMLTLIILCSIGSGNAWGETLFSQTGTSGYSIPDGWSNSGTSTGAYLGFTSNGAYLTSPLYEPHDNLSLAYTVACYGSGTNHALVIQLLDEDGTVKASHTTGTPKSTSYISTNSPWNIGNVGYKFRIKFYLESAGKGVRLRNFSLIGDAATTTVTVSPESITFPSAELSGEGASGSATVDMSVTNGSQLEGQYLCAWVESDDEENCEFTINEGVYSTCSGNATSINDLSVEYYAIRAGTFTGRITVYGYKANMDPVEKVIELSVTITSSCSSAVSIATGSPTNCTISASAASVSTCSGSRQVTISVTPNSCYAAPVKASVTSTGTTATWVSGPTLNADHYDYVYSFAENATGTATFNCSLSTKTTYTVQYNAGATTCTGGNAITGSHVNDTKTCGINMTLPGVVFTTTGYTQDGWATSDGGSKVYDLSATNYATEGDATLYPHWTANKYTVTWSVNGTNYSEGTPSTSVNHGSHVSTLPTAPDPASYCGDVFVGWTDEEYSGDSAPKRLYKTASEFPNATGNQTFYAVFADYAN